MLPSVAKADILSFCSVKVQGARQFSVHAAHRLQHEGDKTGGKGERVFLIIIHAEF